MARIFYPGKHSPSLSFMSLSRPVRKIARMAEKLISEPAPRKRRWYNPAKAGAPAADATPVSLALFSYDAEKLDEQRLPTPLMNHFPESKTSWLNIEGTNQAQIEQQASAFDIHPLLVEDILNVGQRAKMDEINNLVFCLVPMLYYNENTGMVETEQVSLVLVPNGVLSFQEEARRDPFDPTRARLRNNKGGKLRSSGPDFLLYSLLDVIVDAYFGVIERLDQRAEELEDEILATKREGASAKVALLRREILTVIRAIAPVREVINGLLRSESPLMEDNNEKYYKDILDHILHAIDSAESMRDVTSTLLELTFNQVNMRTNDIVKVFTIITTLLAPATVIGGIFGMNFDVIPLSHQREGFFLMVALMLIIPMIMLVWFRRKGWF